MTYNVLLMANRDISKRVTHQLNRFRKKRFDSFQIWVPDTRAPEFTQEAHRQSALAAATDSAAEDQAWVDDISQFSDEGFGTQ